MHPHPHQRPIAVVDMGSGTTRIGFGGEEAPRVMAPTVVGAPRQSGMTGSLLRHHSDTFAGDAAWERRGILSLSHPVQGRRVVSYEGVEEILQDAFYSWLPNFPGETPLLWLEPTCTPREERERLCEIFFEGFDFPQLAIADAAAATVYSTGRTTGLVVDSGEGCTTINALWEGYKLQHASHFSSVAGRVLTDRLLAFLRDKGYPFSTEQDRCLAEEIKRSLCYVAIDTEREMVDLRKKARPVSYDLPDEQRIYLQESRFMVPELLFTPLKSENSGGEGDCIGWAEAVTQVVEKAPSLTQSALLENIVLGGGNTMFPGIEQRLQRDVAALNVGNQKTVNCVAFLDRDMAAWIGGSVVASMPTFPDLCLARKDYQENGAAAIHVKV